MNLTKALQAAVAVSAIALSFVSTSSFAATADGPLSLRTCTVKGNCEPPDPNGPSLDGFVVPVPAGVKQHGQHDMNGPSLDGFADTSVGHDSKAPSIRTCPSKGNCDFPDQNGPSLDGFAPVQTDAPSLRTCTIKNNCDLPDPNGPSLDGLADLKLGTVFIAIHTS
ncbi:hypothetical protein DFR24_4078 [Panacagrimonas perspica]|uniref:Uncharacterized protein n=1 Tax=Panacagrimonas perspica TaxID=381431 RepID=A0A4R7NWN1_9GAMM|nr:hypothetical protein [Panacagrimonas perspica]TDU25635.1 hypothetical protein DFR24_4078 [Panacagrimonas perspica]THD03772.1 hypothetical protein B1810_07790 [Panacagrimonas perspica]